MEQIEQTLMETIQNLWSNAIVRAVVTIVLCLLVYYIAMAFIKKAIKRSKIDPNAKGFTRSVIQVVLVILTILTILKSAFNVDITSFVALFSVAGVAISLAVQDSLGNFASGVLLLFSRPFVKGDVVTVGDIIGTVDEVGLVYTKLTTADNKAVFIPNGQMAKSTVLNANTDTTARLDLVYPIAYTADLLKAKEILTDIAENSEMLLTNKEIMVAVKELADSSVNLLLRVWCENQDKFALTFYINEQVKLRFDEEGIEIPYQKIDVQLVEQQASKDIF